MSMIAGFILAAGTTRPATTELPPDVQRVVGVVFIGLLLLSPVVAWRLGLFRGRSIVGPARLDTTDTFFRYLLILFCGFTGMLLGSVLLAPFFGGLPAEQRAMVVGMLAWFFAFATVLIAAARLSPGIWRRLGFAPARARRALLAGAVGLLIVAPWLFWITAIAQQLLDRYGVSAAKEHPIFTIWKEQRPAFWFQAMTFLFATILAPLFEEVVFRGILQTGLTRLFTPGALRTELIGAAAHPVPAPLEAPIPADAAPQPEIQAPPVLSYAPPPLPEPISPPPFARWAGILSAALIFASFHRPWFIALPVFVLAVGLGYLYERTANLWAPIFMHLLFNSAQFTLFILIAH